jgi:WD40 repeat protein
MLLAEMSCERAIAQEAATRLADWKQQPDSSEDDPRPRHMVRLFGAQDYPRKPWAVILCKFSDLPDFEPYPVNFYRERFTELGDGKGTEFDYIREVTYGKLDITGSKVFGWFLMRQHNTSELPTLKYPAGRSRLHDWGVEVARAHGIDLRPFHGVLVVFNHPTDSGSCGGHRLVFAYKDRDWLPAGNVHEFGHGFDLGHSWSARPDAVYGDRWDIMSAMRVFTFKDSQGHLNGPGMNAWNLRKLGCIPNSRVFNMSGNSGARTITLAALNRPEAKGYLMASIRPAGKSRSEPTYLIEFRQNRGWDAGIPRDTVLVHEVRANGTGYILKNEAPTRVNPKIKRPSPYELLPGQVFKIPVRQLTIRAQSFDAEASTAKVSITLGPTGNPVEDVQTLECFVPEQNKQAHLWNVKFSPDSRLLLAAGDAGPAGTIHIWEVATGKERPPLLPGTKAWLSNAVFTQDGKQVVACYSQDNRVLAWDASTGAILRELKGYTQPATNVAVSHDGRLALASSKDQTLLIWDLADGHELHRLPINSEQGAGTFSPDGKFVLSYGDDPPLRLWDLQSGNLVHELAGHSTACTGLFSQDGRQILSFSSDKTVRLWNADKGKQIRLFEGCEDVVWGAAFLNGSKQVAAWGKDRMLRIWDAESGKAVRKVTLGKDWKLDPTTLALSSDGRRLLTSHEDDSVHLRDLPNGAELCRFVNLRKPRGLAFSPDGRFAASGSFRAGVSLLRLPE